MARKEQHARTAEFGIRLQRIALLISWALVLTLLPAPVLPVPDWMPEPRREPAPVPDAWPDPASLDDIFGPGGHR